MGGGGAATGGGGAASGVLQFENRPTGQSTAVVERVTALNEAGYLDLSPNETAQDLIPVNQDTPEPIVKLVEATILPEVEQLEQLATEHETATARVESASRALTEAEKVKPGEISKTYLPLFGGKPSEEIIKGYLDLAKKLEGTDEYAKIHARLADLIGFSVRESMPQNEKEYRDVLNTLSEGYDDDLERAISYAIDYAAEKSENSQKYVGNGKRHQYRLDNRLQSFAAGAIDYDENVIDIDGDENASYIREKCVRIVNGRYAYESLVQQINGDPARREFFLNGIRESSKRHGRETVDSRGQFAQEYLGDEITMDSLINQLRSENIIDNLEAMRVIREFYDENIVTPRQQEQIATHLQTECLRTLKREQAQAGINDLQHSKEEATQALAEVEERHEPQVTEITERIRTQISSLRPILEAVNAQSAELAAAKAAEASKASELEQASLLHANEILELEQRIREQAEQQTESLQRLQTTLEREREGSKQRESQQAEQIQGLEERNRELLQGKGAAEAQAEEANERANKLTRALAKVADIVRKGQEQFNTETLIGRVREVTEARNTAEKEAQKQERLRIAEEGKNRAARAAATTVLTALAGEAPGLGFGKKQSILEQITSKLPDIIRTDINHAILKLAISTGVILTNDTIRLPLVFKTRQEAIKLLEELRDKDGLSRIPGVANDITTTLTAFYQQDPGTITSAYGLRDAYYKG
jgi:hypothetical protein